MIKRKRVMGLGRKNKTNVIQRLNRIEGQIKGVQRMVEDEEPCAEILTQIAAARGGALAQVGKVIFNRFSTTCLREALARGRKRRRGTAGIIECFRSALK